MLCSAYAAQQHRSKPKPMPKPNVRLRVCVCMRPRRCSTRCTYTHTIRHAEANTTRGCTHTYTGVLCFAVCLWYINIEVHSRCMCVYAVLLLHKHNMRSRSVGRSVASRRAMLAHMRRIIVRDTCHIKTNQMHARTRYTDARARCAHTHTRKRHVCAPPSVCWFYLSAQMSRASTNILELVSPAYVRGKYNARRARSVRYAARSRCSG